MLAVGASAVPLPRFVLSFDVFFFFSKHPKHTVTFSKFCVPIGFFITCFHTAYLALYIVLEALPWLPESLLEALELFFHQEMFFIRQNMFQGLPPFANKILSNTVNIHVSVFCKKS